MVAESGRADPPLAKVLFEEPYRFDFFQAVRLLERLYPQRVPVGLDGPSTQEVVRFRSKVSLTFPPSEIYEIVPAPKTDGPVQMTVAFMGLAGLLGPLPRHYTELILQRAASKDGTLREFLDLFNHRLISIFYRAWEKHHFPVAYERTRSNRLGHDRFSECLFALIGLGLGGMRGRLGVEDESLLPYAGLILQRPRSARSLEHLLNGYFKVSVDVVQFQGLWVALAEEDLTCLGRRLGPGEANNVLGVSAIAGTSVWDQQAKFRIRLGPLSFRDFCRFLPRGNAFRPLVHVTEFFVGREFEFDLQPILKAAEVPSCRLGGTDTGASQLGWSTWLKTKDFQRDAEDVVIAGRFAWAGATPGVPDRTATRGVA